MQAKSNQQHQWIATLLYYYFLPLIQLKLLMAGLTDVFPEWCGEFEWWFLAL